MATLQSRAEGRIIRKGKNAGRNDNSKRVKVASGRVVFGGEKVTKSRPTTKRDKMDKRNIDKIGAFFAKKKLVVSVKAGNLVYRRGSRFLSARLSFRLSPLCHFCSCRIYGNYKFTFRKRVNIVVRQN